MYKLNNGNYIPRIGFGTFKSVGEQAYNSVLEAIKVGYRHIDTASYYNNEKEVGLAIRDSKVNRNELFVTTKVWNTVHSYDDTLKAIDESLNKLGLEYIDLYLIHWPNPESCRDNWQKRNNEVYRAMEDAYKAGKIKNLGLSNFEIHHIEELMKSATIMPVVNQIKICPGIKREKLIDYCKQKNILIEAWGPLGQGELIENEIVKEIAQKYNISVSKLLLVYSLQNGYIPLPKSINPERIKQNLVIDNVTIDENDMEILLNLEGITQPRDADNIPY